AQFASRAYRHPAKPDEIERLMKLIAARRQTGRSPLEAYGDALKAILCSPAFLYLDESGNDESGGRNESGDKRLSSYALASRLSTQRLIDENLSVVNFLNSDFTYVNKPLARLYGVQPPHGSGFELVKLQDGRRGGLIGQASVLTVTANGIDTSPVVRGVWLLE